MCGGVRGDGVRVTGCVLGASEIGCGGSLLGESQRLFEALQ